MSALTLTTGSVTLADLERIYREELPVRIDRAADGGYVDGIGASVRVYRPRSIRSLADGVTVVFADDANNCIRKINLMTSEFTVWMGNCASPGIVEGYGTTSRFNRPYWA